MDRTACRRDVVRGMKVAGNFRFCKLRHKPQFAGGRERKISDLSRDRRWKRGLISGKTLIRISGILKLNRASPSLHEAGVSDVR